MSRRLRWVVVALAGASSLVLGAAVYGYRSLATWSGEMQARGLAQSIDIVRDRNGVTHIFANEERDAYFGLGFAHAQDRLWQMEINRRLPSGKMAEVFGREALPRDRLFRTLGLRRAAEASLPQLDALTRQALEGYVRGVNAFLQSDPVLPIEFHLLRVEVEPWTEVDALVWLKMMAWMLAGNLDTELSRASLSERLDPAALSEFLAPNPDDEPVLLRELGEGLRPAAEPATVTGGLFDAIRTPATGLGSNNWVVAGPRSESGKPLLANDPHLALTSPALWYLAHLHAPGLEVIGATLPGVPGVVLGRNDAVAWAFTNSGFDTQDVFVERLVEGDPRSYETPEGPRPFVTTREVIHVKGAPDEHLDVRHSRHGPVLSGVYNRATKVTGAGHVLTLAWTALAPDDDTLAFVVHAAHAADANGLEQATRHLAAVPQNVVYADSAGEIGWIAAGRVPMRGPGATAPGVSPVSGWDGQADWHGFIPFEQLPRERDPQSGRIVTANQKITPPGYAHWLSAEWAHPARAERLRALIDQAPRHTLSTFSAMQLDVQSGSARAILPQLLALAAARRDQLSARGNQWLDRLAGWDLEMRSDAAEPLVFSAWLRELSRLIYADELGHLFDGAWAERVGFLSRVLSDSQRSAHWCDNVKTAETETCGEQARSALGAALLDLDARYGDDPADWSWGHAHRARARHFPMTRIPIVRDWFDITVDSDGGTNTVNVGVYSIDDEQAPFESRHAAGYRAVYDLANPEQSRFIVYGGPSGNVFSPHYRRWAEAWQKGELVPMLTERTAVEQGALGTLRIEPAAQ